MEPFQSISETVAVYACGIIRHDATHLGYALSYRAAGGLVRYLEMKGRLVTYQ